MSTASKGSTLERYAVSILERRGYRCTTAGKVLKRIPPKVPGEPARTLTAKHDFFGAFDIVATHPTKSTLWVQVSVIGERSRKVKQVAPALPNMSLEHNDIEIWSWIGGRRPHGQRFRVLTWNGMEWADSPDQVLPITHDKPKQEREAAE